MPLGKQNGKPSQDKNIHNTHVRLKISIQNKEFLQFKNKKQSN